jgi:hypothetical protein
VSGWSPTLLEVSAGMPVFLTKQHGSTEHRSTVTTARYHQRLLRLPYHLNDLCAPWMSTGCDSQQVVFTFLPCSSTRR